MSAAIVIPIMFVSVPATFLLFLLYEKYDGKIPNLLKKPCGCWNDGLPEWKERRERPHKYKTFWIYPNTERLDMLEENEDTEHEYAVERTIFERIYYRCMDCGESFVVHEKEKDKKVIWTDDGGDDNNGRS